jgi:hypothetical protein
MPYGRVVKLGTVVRPLVALGLLALCACGPSHIERPLEGAPVGGEARATSAAIDSGPPPTLAPAGSQAGPPAGSPTAGEAVASSPPPSPSPSPLPGFVIVATDGQGANMRVSPSTSARVITTLREGTAVAVLGDPIQSEGRAWRQIQSGNQVGWVVAVVVRAR